MVRPGSVLSTSIYTGRGDILLAVGTALPGSYIERRDGAGYHHADGVPAGARWSDPFRIVFPVVLLS
jgi:hypothetical protein